MTIAVEVAKAEGARNRMLGRERNCRDLPSPPPPPAETQRKKSAAGEKTLAELLDESSAYAKRELAKIEKKKRK